MLAMVEIWDKGTFPVEKLLISWPQISLPSLQNLLLLLTT